jgi:membrane fusion protein, multidrug efflux system
VAEADPQIAIEAQAARPKRRWGRLAVMLSVPLLILIGAIGYWLSLQGRVTTDNAYVQLDKVSISAEVGGQIVAVMVKENQQVRAGDLLFRIDPEPYRLKLAQADAGIATAQASEIAAASDSDLSGAEIAAAREAVAFARSTQARQEALWQRGFTTRAEWEAARHATAQAEETLRLAQAQSREAAAKLASGAQVPGVYPQLAAARAQRSLTQFDLARTEVRAPVSGNISQADRLHLGQELVPGLPALTIVADGTGYVEANFKETDLARMQVGQTAELRFDAYPGLVLRGHVASIGAGTGSEFSVLPAQNASGNWVKVTQRVPVRIALDQASPRRLIAGLSSRVTVFVDGRKR